MTKKTHAFDIVLIPSKEVCSKAMAVSRQLEKRGGLFTLDGVKYFPHITLFATEFSEKNIPTIEKNVRGIALQTRPFKMTSLRYRQEGHGYVGVDYRKSKSIKGLREKIIDSLHSVCEKCKRRKEFIPHLTFTKFEHYTPSALSRIEERDFSFQASAIGIFYLGTYGTCRKLVNLFEMK